MNKIIKVILSIVLVITITISSLEASDMKTTNYSNGNVKSRTWYNSNLMTKKIEYRKDGSKELMYTFQSNGKVYTKYYYNNNDYQYRSYRYDKNGRKVSAYDYKTVDGFRQIVKKWSYNTKGKKVKYETFRTSLLNERIQTIIYNENGQVKSKTYFNDARPSDAFYAEGVKRMTVYYKAGRKVKEVKYCQQSGAACEYKNIGKEIEKITYYTNGKRSKQVSYYDMNRNGKQKEECTITYDSKGKSKKSVAYFENRKKSLVKNYNKGKVVSSYEYFSNGQLYQKITYKNGKKQVTGPYDQNGKSLKNKNYYCDFVSNSCTIYKSNQDMRDNFEW